MVASERCQLCLSAHETQDEDSGDGEFSHYGEVAEDGEDAAAEDSVTLG